MVRYERPRYSINLTETVTSSTVDATEIFNNCVAELNSC